MPTFNFTVTNKKIKIPNNKSDTYTIIEKDVTGVVYINTDFSYYVIIKGIKYNFTNNSFSCKGKRTVYAQFLDKNKQRVCYIRSSDNKSECNSLFFLPFASGSIVCGNIIYNTILKVNLFKFKKTIIEYMHPDSHKAIQLWRDNEEVLKIKRIELINKFNE